MQKGEQIKEIVVEELPRLRRFAYSLTGSKADADDLTQNVVIRLLKAGVPEEGSAIAWMLRICKNCWIDEMRSRTVRTKAADAIRYDADSANATDMQITNQLDTQRVIEAMINLSENQRIVLSLIAIEGMSYGEAAEVLEVPIGTIMSRVARARANLQKSLGSSSGEVA